MKKTICALVLSILPSTANALDLPLLNSKSGYNLYSGYDDISYNIKKGDTLYTIAKDLCKSDDPKHTVNYLTYRNSIKNPNKIKIGDHIKLPLYCHK